MAKDGFFIRMKYITSMQQSVFRPLLVPAGIFIVMIFCLVLSGTAQAQEAGTQNEEKPPSPQAAPVTEVITETGEAAKDAGEIPVTALPQPEARAAVFIELFPHKPAFSVPRPTVFLPTFSNSRIFSVLPAMSIISKSAMTSSHNLFAQNGKNGTCKP